MSRSPDFSEVQMGEPAWVQERDLANLLLMLVEERARKVGWVVLQAMWVHLQMAVQAMLGWAEVDLLANICRN